MLGLPDLVFDTPEIPLRIHDETTLSSGPTTSSTQDIVKRVAIPANTSTSPPGLVEALTVDPWRQSGKYALGWVYFCIILLALATATRLYHIWTDKVRTATHKDRILLGNSPILSSPDSPYEMSYLESDRSTNKIFPRDNYADVDTVQKEESSISSFSPLNNLITAFRYVFYRPTPMLRFHKRIRPVAFPTPAVLAITFAALVFTTLYCFLPQPLYWRSIAFGSPPLAIRSGMLAVAMMPWLVALSMKANLISMLTGIGHERLNALHRWGGWLCLFLSLIHTVPFYIAPASDKGGYAVFRSYFHQSFYIYGTGIAALVPLCVLCLQSLQLLRHYMYELFVVIHIPVSIVFLAMMFWHCNNYLTSWNYLFATLAIWLLSYISRLFFLNWTDFRKMSWLVGDEAGVYLMQENAVKITIPTQKKWKPGQYVYLRMPGISIFENHPFTIASLCSEDFPSDYGDDYKDMILVFRPFGGFTKRVLNNAVEKGPWHSYRAFIDGPYGGMVRDPASFDHVVLIAGGSGITALVSHLLDLIKRMRDGKAVTKRVQIIWALKRPDILEWFKEELRICRDFAPPDTVECQFFITAAKRVPATGQLVSASTPSRPIGDIFHHRVNGAFQDIAHKRWSHLSEVSTGRQSALIHDEAAGDAEKERELRDESEDKITALPEAHMMPQAPTPLAVPSISHPTPVRSAEQKRQPRQLSLDVQAAAQAQPGAVEINGPGGFDFGFPTTPTDFHKSLMRFAFFAPGRKRDGWSIEYGRPDVPYMLRQASKEFGRRTCVFVCGPPSMRMDVCKAVADLQADVLKDSRKDELFLHTENYSL